MDTTGKYPKLSNSDPLFQIADYTQQMSAALNPVATGPVFTNGWSNFGGSYNIFKTKEIVSGVVSLSAMLRPGTLTDGVQIATIEATMRPNVSVYAPALIRAGSVNRQAMISINSSGVVALYGDLTGTSYVIINIVYNKVAN